VVLTGVATGLFGDLLMWLLTEVERAGFHYHSGYFQNAVAAVSSSRRIIVLLIGSVIGAVSWYLIRRYLKHEKSDIDDAIWNGDGELSLRRSFLTSIVSEVVIGLGASIGREAAPKLMGGASGSMLSHWFNLSPAQKRLLVACGGGAGLACVYNVPLGGAIFTAEVLYGSFALPVVMPALVTSLIATHGGLAVSTHRRHLRRHSELPLQRLRSWSGRCWPGVVIGLLAVFYVRLIGWAAHFRAKGAQILWIMPWPLGSSASSGSGIPQLFGNGKDMAHEAFLGRGRRRTAVRPLRLEADRHRDDAR
jgi:chloride channel protein, CIC family